MGINIWYLTVENKATDIEILIKTTIEGSVRSFFLNKQVKTTHVLDKIFPKERRIRSLIGGLETSFGSRVWEPLAKAFAKQNGFEILNEKEFNNTLIPQTIPPEIALCYEKWRTKRELTKNTSLDGYIEELKGLIKTTDLTEVKYGKGTKGKGVDIWIKKDGHEYIYDIKTNQINAGDGNKFNGHIMLWYLYRLIKEPECNITCQIAFPFNPHNTNFWKKEGGKASPLIPSVDAVVEGEFWNFLLGEEDSWQKILSTFAKLGEENFGDNFSDIFKSN